MGGEGGDTVSTKKKKKHLKMVDCSRALGPYPRVSNEERRKRIRSENLRYGKVGRGAAEAHLRARKALTKQQSFKFRLNW